MKKAAAAAAPSTAIAIVGDIERDGDAVFLYYPIDR